MIAPTSRPIPDLDTVLTDLESTLAALGESTRNRDAAGIEQRAQQLQELLGRMAQAVDPAHRPTRQPLPPRLRTRLLTTGRQIAIQRTALAKVARPVDSAVALLTPPDSTVVYVEGQLPNARTLATRYAR
jgi:hypothetical protein